MNQHETYMQLAIAVARQTKLEGGVAIGAVLVHETSGEVVSVGGSVVAILHDPTAHAEVVCIRGAASKLGTDDLFGYTLYSTLEPCHMCLSAAAWARIKTIYFGAYRRDVDEALFDISGDFSDEVEAMRMNLRESVQMQAHGGICEQECAAMLADYHDRARHTTA